jgi:hypothetical protein
MDQSGISPIGLGGHLPKGEGRGKPYQGSPAHWEGYYYSPSQGKGYFEFYYFVGEPITLGWEKLLKSNTNSIRTVASDASECIPKPDWCLGIHTTSAVL